MGNVLVIGNKNYSSWSLRPWLYLAVHDIPFEERCIPLYGSGSRAAILAYSDAGLVPVFLRDGLKVWDSLAILETLAELYPATRAWPQDTNERAWARAISAEMHAGFGALRTHLPMNLRRRIDPGELTEDVAAEVLRVRTIWHECRKAHPRLMISTGLPVVSIPYMPAALIPIPCCPRLILRQWNFEP